MRSPISYSVIFNMDALQNFLRPEQELTRIALALNISTNALRSENRSVVKSVVNTGAYNSLVTFSIKPHFMKWLFFGREFYQAKFSNNVQLIAIVKLKIRGYF